MSGGLWLYRSVPTLERHIKEGIQRRQVVLDDSAGRSRRFLRQLANLHSNEPPVDYALLYGRDVSVRRRNSIAHVVLTVEHDSVHLFFIAPFGNTCSSSMMKLMARRAFNSASSPVVRKLHVTEESNDNPLWKANSMKLSTGHSFSVMELPESAVSRDWIYHGRDAKTVHRTWPSAREDPRWRRNSAAVRAIRNRTGNRWESPDPPAC